MNTLDQLKRIANIPRPNTSYAYQMGRDYAMNGANETNCHFSIFSSRENTAEWEKGRDDTEAELGKLNF